MARASGIDIYLIENVTLSVTKFELDNDKTTKPLLSTSRQPLTGNVDRQIQCRVLSNFRRFCQLWFSPQVIIQYMELDLKSLFGLHVHTAQLYLLAETPQPLPI